jgi:alkylation response protein AidB-like acyl-CoA dehydrogenase
MNFELEYTSDQESFRTDVRSWLNGVIPGDLDFPVDAGDMSYDQYLKRRDIGRALGEKGWLWPTAPVEYGGGGLTVDQAIIIDEEVEQRGLTLPPYYDSGGRLGGASIMVWGSDEQKAHFLPPIFKGEVRTWQLLTEPNAGSDLAGVQTTAIRDADEYVINGQKIFVGSNHGAEQSWMITVTDPNGERHKNLSWFIVPMDLPGITVMPMDLLTTGGEGGAGTGEKNTIFFDNVRVPAFNLIGEENDGWRVASTHLELEHGGGGSLRRNNLVDRLIAFCKETHRNGQPLSKDMDVRDSLVDIYIEAETSRLFALRNYWQAATKQPRSYEGPQSSYHRKTSALRIAEGIMEILGPYSLTSDPKWGPLGGSIELHQRSSIVGLHPGGTADIQKVIMARRIGIGRSTREEAGALA